VDTDLLSPSSLAAAKLLNIQSHPKCHSTWTVTVMVEFFRCARVEPRSSTESHRPTVFSADLQVLTTQLPYKTLQTLRSSFAGTTRHLRSHPATSGCAVRVNSFGEAGPSERPGSRPRASTARVTVRSRIRIRGLRHSSSLNVPLAGRVDERNGNVHLGWRGQPYVGSPTATPRSVNPLTLRSSPWRGALCKGRTVGSQDRSASCPPSRLNLSVW